MSDAPKPQPPHVTVKINDEMQRGVYANRVIIAHSSEEFVFDFVSDLPPGPQVVARIVTSPAHAHALLDALNDNLGRYKTQFGAIRRPAGPPPRADA